MKLNTQNLLTKDSIFNYSLVQTKRSNHISIQTTLYHQVYAKNLIEIHHPISTIIVFKARQFTKNFTLTPTNFTIKL